MSIDLCLEASGSVAHLITTDTVSALLPARWRASRSIRGRSAGRVAATTRVDVGWEGAVIDRRVAAAIDRLPFLLVRVLWLIDVCRCSYDTAAVELGISPAQVERLVVVARHRVRHDLGVIEVTGPPPVSDSRRSCGGSTSRSRPGWQPPTR